MRKFVAFASIMILGAVLLGIGIDAHKWVLIIPGICGLVLAAIYGFIIAAIAIDKMVDEKMIFLK